MSIMINYKFVGFKTLEVVNSYKNLNDPNGKYIKNNFFLRCQEDGTGKYIILFTLSNLCILNKLNMNRYFLR